MIEHSIFDHAANWVCSKISPSVVTPAEIASALRVLHAAALDLGHTVLIPDLFKTVALDVLFIYDGDGKKGTTEAEQSSLSALGGQLSAQALDAVGAALDQALTASGNDMATYLIDNSEVIVSRFSVRAVVLQATGTTLLTSQ